MEVDNQILLELINFHSIASLIGFMKIITMHYIFLSCERVEKKIFCKYEVVFYFIFDFAYAAPGDWG